MSSPPRAFADNCPIREYTADGVSVGRCWMWLGGTKFCLRHGNVTEAVQHSGELTDDPRFRKAAKQANL